MGGKLRGERRVNATNVTGSGIDGGTSHHIAKGDFLLVPENTAHGFTETDGTLVNMSFHVPGSGAARCIPRPVTPLRRRSPTDVDQIRFTDGAA